MRALAIAHADGKDILVSAGIDTQLVVYSANTFSWNGVRRIPPFPHKSIVELACKARMLMVQLPTKIQVCNVAVYVRLLTLSSPS